MSLLADLTADTRMPAAKQYVRLRARRVTNRYNPTTPSEDWNTPECLSFYGAFANSSSTVSRDELDTTTNTRAVLTTTMAGLDITTGDRIRADPDDGHLWVVTGVPAQDINPFTGWQPSMEINLEEVIG